MKGLGVYFLLTTAIMGLAQEQQARQGTYEVTVEVGTI